MTFFLVRLYLLPVPPHLKRYKSTILSSLEETKAVEKYTKLEEKSFLWNKKRRNDFIELPLKFVTRKKKRLG